MQSTHCISRRRTSAAHSFNISNGLTTLQKLTVVILIQRRFDEQFKKGKGETDTSKIKRNIACSLYAILDTIQNGTKVTPQKDKNSWQIHKNGFTAIIKRENGKYLFTGFYDHRTEKQAAETIKAVNAKYGYTPGFLDMYDQVGAALTSMGKFNS